MLISGLDLNRLEALATAVSEGTFEAAAGKLHVTPSAISQRVKALETATGRVLLVRSKPVEPTPSGAALLRAARQIQVVTDDLARELGGTKPGGLPVVALAINADSLATWLLPALAAARSEVTFDIRREDQERTSELLRQGTVMAAVTASSVAVPGCSVEPLGRMRYRPLASPAFARRWFGDGVTVANLARAPVVVFDRDDRLQHVYLRRRTRRDLEPPVHYVPGSEAFVQAVDLGIGWGMVPDLQAEDGARDLVEIDPNNSLDVELFWQQWRLRSAALERVADLVRRAAHTALLRTQPQSAGDSGLH
jgi:LysR family transcriptional regulator, chromosome initiation inhibitor